MLLSAGFLLAGLTGLGNAVFLLAPLGLLLMSVIALALLVMTEIRAAYLAWLAAYVPLVVSLGLHSGLFVDESEKTLEPDGK
jgi:hypothetical protein